MSVADSPVPLQPLLDIADSDPTETQEWLEALESVVHGDSRSRGQFLLRRLDQRAQELGIVSRTLPYSAYQNTIPLEQQAAHPGDVAVGGGITANIWWNALGMGGTANKAHGARGARH